MTLKDNKYSRGKIYKVVDVGYSMCYIGSTCQPLSKRMTDHRTKYVKLKKGVIKHFTVFDIFDVHGVEHCKIELVEEYPCENREQLYRQEGVHIRNTECVNKVVPNRTNKQYHQVVKERIAERKKQYIQDNKERIAVRKKQIRIDNPEYARAKDKQYNEARARRLALKQAQEPEPE